VEKIASAREVTSTNNPLHIYWNVPSRLLNFYWPSNKREHSCSDNPKPTFTMITSSRLAQVALTALAVCTPLAKAANATFYPKINMTDASATLIQAHGGAILQSASSDDNNWYWFGEDKTGLTNSGR
jgi:hypothetical protein